MAVAGCAMLAAAALAIYQPHIGRPFAIVDFSEFLPLLARGDDAGSRARLLIDYYASQGRFNVIPYGIIALKWSLFGSSSPGWQLSRAILMLSLALLAYLLLRRLRASRFGAAAGAATFLWAPSAADGWVHLTMAEPLGALLVLTLSIRALRFQQTDRWRREVALFAVAVPLMVLSKELMAPALALPLLLALTHGNDGSFAMPKRSRRNVALVAACLATGIASLAPVAWVYSQAPPAAYASFYGQSWQSPASLVAIWISTLVPFDPVPGTPSLGWALAVMGFTVLVASGWRVGFHHETEGRRARWLLAVALALPFAGALAYLPSPWHARFYSIPYLPATALLTAFAVTYVERGVPKGLRFAIASAGAFMAFAAVNAATYAARMDAMQRRDDVIVDLASRAAGRDSVFFATTRLPPYPWLGTGATLQRYAVATRRPWPGTRDVSCADAEAAVARGQRVAAITFDNECRIRAGHSSPVTRTYRHFNWRRMRVQRDSVYAVIVTPEGIRQ